MGESLKELVIYMRKIESDRETGKDRDRGIEIDHRERDRKRERGNREQ